jgi:uncharacterized membrane protein YraQ (UPF0718 family)
MREFVTVFLALIFETTPFLLAGVLISVIGGPLLERALSGAALRNPLAGMVAGTTAGLFLPMCDCGSRPLAHRMALAGRKEFALAFMVAAPVINPIVVITTWLAFRSGELLVLRLAITAVMALATALVLSRVRGDLALTIEGEFNEHEHHDSGPKTWAPRALDEFFELFQFLVLGSALAAAIQVFLDRQVLTSAEGVFLSIAAMMFLAFLLSICSSVDAFVVAGFGGLGLGPTLAFLTLGPVVNLKSVPMYLRLFSLPAVIGVTLVAVEVVFVSGVVLEYRAW